MPAQHGGRATSLVSNHTRTCRHQIRCLYSEAFASARERIYLTTPYFVPDLLTQQRLMNAARRGIDVRLLVPSRSDVPITRWAAHAFYGELMAAGVRIYEYLPRMLHAKTVVIDGRQCATLGTANLDYRSFFLNYELILVMKGTRQCALLEQHFLEDLSESQQIIANIWARRRWAKKLLKRWLDDAPLAMMARQLDDWQRAYSRHARSRQSKRQISRSQQWNRKATNAVSRIRSAAWNEYRINVFLNMRTALERRL